MSKLKAGDKVDIRDGSYSFGIKNGEYSIGLLTGSDSLRTGLTVVQTDLCVKRDLHDATKICDILVEKDGNFWFALSRFADLAEHIIIIDDKEIKLSNKSFQELKNQLT